MSCIGIGIGVVTNGGSRSGRRSACSRPRLRGSPHGSPQCVQKPSPPAAVRPVRVRSAASGTARPEPSPSRPPSTRMRPSSECMLWNARLVAGQPHSSGCDQVPVDGSSTCRSLSTMRARVRSSTGSRSNRTSSERSSYPTPPCTSSRALMPATALLTHMAWAQRAAGGRPCVRSRRQTRRTVGTATSR